MEFVIDTDAVELTPEKMPEVHYNSSIDEFVVYFCTAHEIYNFIQTYGEVRILPAENEWEYPKIVLE